MLLLHCSGTQERVKVTLCSSLTVGDGDETSSGLSPTREADVDLLGSRYQSMIPLHHRDADSTKTHTDTDLHNRDEIEIQHMHSRHGSSEFCKVYHDW